MTMFDSIITETDERFNLNGKAGTLLSALLALMTDKARGGLRGFLEKFDRNGLNAATSSWIGADANTEISNEDLEAALGMNTLREIANQAGIEYDTATAATAFMTPRVVDALTPEGIVPSDGDWLSRIGGYLSGDSSTEKAVGETFDRIGTAAVPIMDAERKFSGENINPSVGNTLEDLPNRVDANVEYKDDSSLKWILPLILLALLLISGYLFCSKSSEPAKPTSPTANSNTATTNAVNQ